MINSILELGFEKLSHEMAFSPQGNVLWAPKGGKPGGKVKEWKRDTHNMNVGMRSIQLYS
jgi:hypothetical protein